jgi:hypothetical protein
MAIYKDLIKAINSFIKGYWYVDPRTQDSIPEKEFFDRYSTTPKRIRERMGIEEFFKPENKGGKIKVNPYEGEDSEDTMLRPEVQADFADMVKSINKFVAKAEKKYLGYLNDTNFADNPTHRDSLQRRAQREGYKTTTEPFKYRDKNMNESTHYKVNRVKEQ